MNTTHKRFKLTRAVSVPRFRWAAFAIALSLSSGCAAVPPQIAQLHQKELEIITSLQQAHMAMVDAYVDQKISLFDSFYFSEYGPKYLSHWRKNFKGLRNRDYDESRDFQILYNDLVAEYQERVAPIENVRKDLRNDISREYRHAIAAHEAVGGWLKSLEQLKAAHREAIDRLLAAIKPGLSVASVEKAVDDAKAKVREKISELSR